MTYPRFERLAIVLSAVVVLAVTLGTLSSYPDLPEIVAQLLVLLVLFGALHWGRRGGATAGVMAAVAYILMRTPAITQTGFTTQLMSLVAVRVIAFGLIGVLGGELCSRLKYLLAELDDSAALDRESGVYSRTYMARAIREALGLFERYAAPFALLIVTSPEPPRRKHRAGALAVASHLRDAVRLVDDVGTLGDGRFVMLLHHTKQPGAEIVAARVRAVLHDALQIEGDRVRTDILGAAEDLIAVRTFIADIAPTRSERMHEDTRPAGGQPSSGA